MTRKALLVALSEKARSRGIVVVDGIILDAPKTKEVAVILKSFRDKMIGLGSVLIVLPSVSKDLYRASKNIQKLGVVEARNLNPLETLSYKSLMVLKDSIRVLGNLKS